MVGFPQVEFSIAMSQGVASDKRWHVRKNKAQFFADGVLVPLKDSAEQVHGFSKIFRDASSERLAMEELRRLAEDLAEADRRKSEFLATLAHELRNPLAPIKNGLGILRASGDNPAALGKTREMMERQVNHMVHMVDDLLDISRISGGKIELKKDSVTIQELIANAVETSVPLIEGGQHRLVINMPDEAVRIHVDPTRISQVVSNLLNNAAKYTPTGGEIRLSAKVAQGNFVLSVEDNGIGIPEKALPSIFEMFNQVGRNMGQAQGGLGIGLTLVRQIVEMHGGAVTVQSTENAGSTFEISLPVVQSDSEQGAKPNVAEKPELQPLRIMVVDDNVDAAQSLSTLLQFGGHTLFVAHSGPEAIKVATDCKPQIAFLDIGMPGMDGYQTATAIRKIAGLEGIVLVALTGWGAEDDKNRSRAAGFDNHITKPAQLEVIESLLASVETTVA